jgi:hypothetical protein
VWTYASVLVVVTIASIVLYFRLRALLFATRSTTTPDANFCRSQDAILFAQREQFNRAKIDLFGSSQVGTQEDDLEFYKSSFGAVEVLLDKNPLSLTAISYYRIYKNANDNIRSLLLEYAYELGGNQREYHRRNCTFNLDCLHSRLHNLTPMSLKTLYFPYHHRRYAFSFTREPLSRFIAAMTEIEYRIQVNLNGRKDSANLPLQHPIGTQQRFHEFVKMLVLSGGSQKLYRDNRAVEIAHITPQIGTVLLGSKIEEDDFHLFKLEDFESSWKNISESTKLPILETLRKRRTEKNWPVHPSSRDPFNTTLAARSFLSHASTDAYHRFAGNLSDRLQPIPPGFTANDYPRVAKQYLRALCRIYLVDYVCLRYSLPEDCQDLETEMLQSFQEFQHTLRVKSSDISMYDHLRELLPKSVMRTIASYACLWSDSPECEVQIVHGSLPEDIERHDEL